jgi:hypothetical protein
MDYVHNVKKINYYHMVHVMIKFINANFKKNTFAFNVKLITPFFKTNVIKLKKALILKYIRQKNK